MAKRSRNLKGWELLALSIVLFIAGTILNGSEGSMLGGLLDLVAAIFFLFSIVAFVRELRAKRKTKKLVV